MDFRVSSETRRVKNLPGGGHTCLVGKALRAHAASLRLSPLALALVALGLVVTDWGTQLAGASTVPGGPLDEGAHLLTTLLVLWALGPRAYERFLLPALLASVAIDLDHIPGRLGVDWLTAGTPRPYTHSLLTIAVCLAAAALWGRRRDLLLGIAVGLAIHFWRDMGEHGSGVSLLWPLSNHVFSLPHATYVIVMAVVIGFDAHRCRRSGTVVTRHALSGELDG